MKAYASSLLLVLLLAGAIRAAEPGPRAGDDARALAIGRAFLQYQEQLAALQPPADSDPQWWKSPVGPGAPSASAATREKMVQAERDFRAAVAKATGFDPIPSGGRDLRYTFLPEAKQAAAARIDQLYASRASDLRLQTMSTRLPSDYDKIRALALDRERALHEILTPAEFEMLDMRTSNSGMTLRSRYGDVIESEDEFRKLFALQKALDEKYSTEAMTYSARPSDTMRARSDAERKMLDDVKAIVGDARFVAFRRANDQEVVALKGLVRRFNLPANTIDAVMDLREQYAKTSVAIAMQPAVNPSDRRTLLQDLEKEARQKLTEILGRDGLDGYASRAQWLRYLEGGTAFSTDPNQSSITVSSSTTTTVYPVLISGGTVLRPTASGAPASPPPTPISPGFSTSPTSGPTSPVPARNP
jgi:hypothetical protein